MGSVAAQVASWQRRNRNLPGPLAAPTGGSGDSPNGSPVQVELYVNGTWVDITSYVMTRDGGGKISISRGQPDESAQTNPGRCAFQLNNRNGQFSPRNPVGPYYGQLGRNQPLRVSVQSGNSKSYRFWGEVVAWPQDWDVTGVDVWVELEAAGILRRLGQGSAPVVSPMRASITGNDLGFSPVVVAYWPMEDPAGSASMASGLPSGSSMKIIESPSLASFGQFAGSASIPQMTAGSKFFGSVPAYTQTAITALYFLMVIPSGGLTNGTVLCSVGATGTITRWDIVYSTSSGGSVGINGYNVNNMNVFSIAAFGSNLNGVLCQTNLQLQQSGPDISVFGDVTALISGAAAFPTTDYTGTGTASSQTLGLFSSVAVAPNGDATGAAFGQIRVEASQAPFFLPGDETGTLQGAFGEAADDRFRRLCLESSVPHVPRSAQNDAVVMGPQSVGSFLNVVNECVVADGGVLFELETAVGLDYRPRQKMENQSPALTLSYTAFNLSEVPKPVDDDRYTRNDITVTRTGGSWARADLPSGALSVLPPPAGVGPYPDAKTVNIQSDSSLPDQAGWRLHLGTVDEARYPTISVNLAHASFVNNPALRNQVLAVSPGDRITVTNPPSWVGPNDISQIVLGFAETIDHFQHRITFNCTPEVGYRVAVADDAFYARADTDGSSFAADAQPADTSISVATAGSFATWSTDLSEPPFDLSAGGERMTVVAVGTVLNPNPLLLSGLTGWTSALQNSTISLDTSVVDSPHGATASIFIVPNGTSASGGVVSGLTGVGTVTPGNTYIVSGWFYSPGGWPDLRPATDWYDSSGTFLSSGLGSGTSVAAGVWTFIQQTLTAPASASQATMRGRHGGTPSSSNVWYAWNLRLVPSSSVSSSSPQTLTVVRSVNGVVKLQPTGTDIRLYQPAITALSSAGQF